MKNSRVDNILNRLKSVLKCKTDTDLAKELGINQSRLSTWRSRGTIDLFYILDHVWSDVNLNWLLRGTPTEKSSKFERDKEYNKLFLDYAQLSQRYEEAIDDLNDKDKKISSLYSKINILQETIMKMNAFYTQDEEELSEMSVKKVPENNPEYK